MDERALTRVRVIYAGTVQGVSFRATARQLAAGRPVVGFVCNLPDGTVELEAEGAGEIVAGLLAAIAREFDGYITDARRTEIPPRGNEQRFEIRH